MTDPNGWRQAHKNVRDGYADAVAGLAYIRERYGRLEGVGWDRVEDHFFENVTMPEREGLLAGSLTISLQPLPAPPAQEGNRG